MQGHPFSQTPYSNVNTPGPSQFSYASNTGAFAAQSAATALSSPYMQYQYPQAPHYAQAYAQFRTPCISTPGTTAEGYTLSSTYAPGSYIGPSVPSPGTPGPQKPSHRGAVQSHWYQPGNCRCSKASCSFVGSKKAVEVHMMDRHLIYPPGWDKRKKKDDWDADPSLKGKPIPIQGTTIKLDTPEAIDAWVAERKKRFPTAARVEEKDRKLEEAIARGQLQPQDYRFPNRKKRRLNDDVQYGQHTDHSQAYGRGRGRGRSRGRGAGQGRGGGGVPVEPHIPHALPPKPVLSSDTSVNAPGQRSGKHRATALPVAYDSASSASDLDSEGAPEVASSKAVPYTMAPTEGLPNNSSTYNVERERPQVESGKPVSQLPRPVNKPQARQPRKPLYNPFAVRPSLLRNLLTPEIRMTISNLSQATRFLADNDFLENVELKPGQASEKMIEVIGPSITDQHEASVAQHASSEGTEDNMCTDS